MNATMWFSPDGEIAIDLAEVLVVKWESDEDGAQYLVWVRGVPLDGNHQLEFTLQQAEGESLFAALKQFRALPVSSS